MNTFNRIKAEAKQIVVNLVQNGFEAYFVGGYVRDTFLKRKVKDIDIATSALPHEVMQLFLHTIPTGLQHGTVSVLSNGHIIEVTTFRTESSYEHYRRPKQVQFITNLEEDLKRRDFTMNAMAMDQNDQIIDPFGGIKDLQQGLLRAVGDPEERFQEDALRMLRCVRFAANYSLQVDPDTWEALLRKASLLRYIAMERVRVELESIIDGPDPYQGLVLLNRSMLLHYTKQELELFKQDIFLRLDADHFISSVLTHISEVNDRALRWVLLFKAMEADPALVAETLRRLTFSRDQIVSIVPILKMDVWLTQQLHNLKCWDTPDPMNGLSDNSELIMLWKRAALLFGRQVLNDWIIVMNFIQKHKTAMKIADANERMEYTHNVLLQHGKALLDRMNVLQLQDLAITGSDIIQHMGAPAGPWVGKLLAKLLVDVAIHGLNNTNVDLLKRAEQYEV